MFDRNLLDVSAEVEAALRERRAVVALESTVIAHGLPRPQNLETARRLEEIVREQGATPATVAVIKGKLYVGLDDGQLTRLAKDGEVHKLSRRDLPVAVARRWDGATTVATTLWIASRAGVRVFATGGIGGVHRGSLPDVSADLPELARTPMTVVCSSAKIVLDLPATREWLETHGVTVAGYGCDELPAFYTRRSGLPVDVRADTPTEVAELARARDALGIKSALVVAVPVPQEFEVDEELMRIARRIARVGGARRRRRARPDALPAHAHERAFGWRYLARQRRAAGAECARGGGNRARVVGRNNRRANKSVNLRLLRVVCLCDRRRALKIQAVELSSSCAA